MDTFSDRLKKIIEKRGISQAEAAKLCGIAQQSLNYIINSNLKGSKLAPQISSALDINPEWLIYGTGKPDISKLYDLPIMHSAYMLKKHLSDELGQESFGTTVVEVYLGQRSFAYLTKPNEMAICADPDTTFKTADFLVLTSEGIIMISQKKLNLSFPIFEWRKRNEDF